jgi:FlaA1/EpsC-like NDP-sugar epimerase
VTHIDAERYFMTIPEAVQLVLQAGVLAHPGDTFVLDMGDPVRIVDLANDLIALHGLRAEDIEIEFIGLKPGEKLYEELLFPFERAETTSHEAVRRVVQSMPLPHDLASGIAEMRELIGSRHRDRIIGLLQRIVPDYRLAEQPGTRAPRQ